MTHAPIGIFGPGDKVIWPGFIEAAKKGNTNFILGKGDNLMDWTYVDNVALAHLLAADKLTISNPDVAGQVIFATLQKRPGKLTDYSGILYHK